MTTKVTVELPEPDSYCTDDGANAPEWMDLALVGEFLEVWPDGINTTDGFLDAEDITPGEVERAGRALLAVAARMREMPAWKTAGDE